MTDTQEQRLIDIEIKILHQEATIEDLNKVIVEQQEKIQNLETTLSGLVKRFRDLTAEGLEVGPHNEKPPHY
jgi:SlyX protein